MKVLVFATVLAASVAYPLDLGSYCKGFCSNRYQDGIERSGKCACIDYYPINPDNRIAPLGVPRKPVFGFIYE